MSSSMDVGYAGDVSAKAAWESLAASADAILMLDVLEHVFDPARLAAELVRVTRAGGLLCIAVPNGLNLANRLRFLAGNPVDYTDVAHRTNALFSEHLRLFGKHSLERLVSTLDAEITERRYYFPDELTDYPGIRRAARLVTGLGLERRMPELFALGFFYVCRRNA